MKSIWVLYIGLILLGICVFIYLDCTNVSIAFDDAYTIRMTQRSFLDILRITSHDVHPPLYYWLLKIYSTVFGYSMHSQRIFSTIGIFATMLLAVFPIRKRLGDTTAFLFLTLLIIFPVSQFLASEIRMYSWAMFFTMGTAIFAYDSYNRGRKTDYLKMGGFALCAAYTHYYALIAAGWIFVVLLIALWREQKRIRIYFITITAFIILYLPWISQFLFQIKQVSHDYWIQPFSMKDIYYHIYFLFSIKKDWLPFDSITNHSLMLGTTIIILSQIGVFSYSVINYIKNRDKKDLISIIGVLLFILPILSGLIFSLLTRPVLVPRYMLCSFDLLLLGLAITYSKYLDNKYLKPIILGSLILLIVSSCIRYWGTIKHMQGEQREAAKLENFINENSESVNGVFLGEYYGASALSRLSILYPDKGYYILTFRQSKETFEPFNLKKVYHNETFVNEFIFVQKSDSENGGIERNFKKTLELNFWVSDSIKALNMELYKMHLRQ